MRETLGKRVHAVVEPCEQKSHLIKRILATIIILPLLALLWYVFKKHY